MTKFLNAIDFDDKGQIDIVILCGYKQLAPRTWCGIAGRNIYKLAGFWRTSVWYVTSVVKVHKAANNLYWRMDGNFV